MSGRGRQEAPRAGGAKVGTRLRAAAGTMFLAGLGSVCVAGAPARADTATGASGAADAVSAIQPAGAIAAEDAASLIVPSRRLRLGQWSGALRQQGTVPAPEPSSSKVTRYVLPVLLSAAIPGAGEIATGHLWNGLPLVAADAATWIGYAHYRNDGADLRTESYRFADRYWKEDRWQDSLAVTHWYDPSSPYNCNCSPPWIPKSEDEREYYENIGKYDWYISGWEDWDPANYDPTKNPPYATDTPLRDQYRAMRGKSNDSLNRANSFVWVSVAARALSVAETAILIHKRRGDGPGGGGGAPVSLRARPRGFSGGEVALEVRFR